jgi:hypothetical protein
MRVLAFAISSLLVLGFYGYVFTQLFREHKRFKALESRLREHLYAIESEGGVKGDPSKTAASPKIPGQMRKDTLIQLGVAIGGLVGLFAEIGFLSQMVNSFH